MTINIATSQELLAKYYIDNNIEYTGCQICGNPIWYPHTKIHKNTKSLVYESGSEKTIKRVGSSTYNLKVCYHCLLMKFPEILNKNSSKLFNTCNKYVKFAFQVTDDDYFNQLKLHGVTYDSLIKKYGKELGIIKWNHYLELQRITNTFE